MERKPEQQQQQPEGVLGDRLVRGMRGLLDASVRCLSRRFDEVYHREVYHRDAADPASSRGLSHLGRSGRAAGGG